MERKKVHRRSEIGKTSYKRIVYLQQLKKDREAMEQYKRDKKYICEKCGMKGVGALTMCAWKGIHKDYKTLTDTRGRAIGYKSLNKDADGEDVCLEKYIMVHHKHADGEHKEFECLCRWCHDKEDQKLRTFGDGKSSKAVDKFAVMEVVKKILEETAGHAKKEESEEGKEAETS